MPNAQETLEKLEDALKRRDKEAAVALYHPDATVIDPMIAEPLRGKAAVEDEMANFLGAFPDLETRVERVIADSDTFAAEVTFEGTHEGPLHAPSGDIPPTHKRVEIHVGAFSKVDDQGRIVEQHRYYDTGGLLGQLGLTG